MEHTARNFVLQLGSLIALYISLSAIVAVAFGIINISFPDELEGYYQYQAAQDSIRFGVALLIVFFPTYAVLTRLVNKARRSAEGGYLTLTKWLIYLSLLVGGGVLLGDLVAVIVTYLNGEITNRFLLKAGVLLVVIGAAFYYYILDARGYWNQHEGLSKQFGSGAAAVVIAVLVFGFYTADSPSEVRDRRLDQQQITDLEEIQWRIEEYYRVEGELPDSIASVYSGIESPEAPNGRSAYEYNVLSETSFELCATFVHESIQGSRTYARPVAVDGLGIKNPYNWDHGMGRTCFDRSLTAATN